MRAVAVAAVLVWGVAGLALAVLPQMQFAHQGLALHVSLETAASLIALLAGFLVFGRLRRHGGVNDLLLACALAVFALLNICLLAMSAFPQTLPKDLMVWVLLIGRSLGAVLFALAAFAPGRHRLWRPGLTLVISVTAGSVLILLVAVVFNKYAGSLAHRLVLALAPDSPKGPEPIEHPALLIFLLLTAALYCAAAAGFFNRSRRLRDEFLLWLAVSAVLAVFSHLNYSFYPSPYAQGVHTGDIFRLCFYTALLIGSMWEISSHWYALSEAAVSKERRRIACELHDGLAQELGYLARHLDSRDGELSEEDLRRLRQAVERAQLESRRAVGTLASRVRPVDTALAAAVAEVAERFHLRLQLDLVAGLKASAAREDALVRIACEAVTNAARHSGASQVTLRLERDGPRLLLRVTDRGRGFDPAVESVGFGLASMRHRARSVGGELRISSTPGVGSEVEAAL